MVTLLVVATADADAAHPADGDAPHLIDRGKALLAEHAFKAAEDAFEEALRKAPGNQEAMRGLGAVAVARSEWGKGKKWYGRVLEQAPGNLDALYHRAVCCRELGKFKALLLRRLEWGLSQRLFEAALARDSLYLDAIYQYAVLKRYQEKYPEAIRLGHRQVALKPDLTAAQVGLFRLYVYFLDNRDAAEAIAWLRSQEDAHSRYFLGEALRRLGRATEADSTLRAWVDTRPGTSAVPALLSLTRLHYEQGEPDTAESFFWAAVDSIRSLTDAFLLFEDVKYVVTEEELLAFRALSSPDSCKTFFRRLWASRDPTPAAETNVRLAAHYARMRYAEAHYVYDGFRIGFNDPDKNRDLSFPETFYVNDRFNDKGLIYIRHGPPNDHAQEIAERITLNDSWFYGKTQVSPEMIFHFVVDVNAAGNNWRLAPYPPTLEGRETWSATYHPRSRLRDPLYQLSHLANITRESRGAVLTGFRTDRHAWDAHVKPLAVDSHLAYFRAPEGKTYVDLYYGRALPSGKALETAADTSQFYDWGLALHDLSWRTLAQRHGQVTAQDIKALRHKKVWIGQYRVAVAPDSCHAAFFLGEPDRRHLGGWKGGIRVPDFSDSSLAVSSIVPAYTVRPAEASGGSARDGPHLTPNPSVRFKRSDPVYIYFEIYNLTRDAYGLTSFVVEYTVSRSRKGRGDRRRFSIFGRGGKPTTSVAVEGRGDSPTSIEYLALDLGRAGRGDFRLNVRVTDGNSGLQAEETLDLVLF